MNKRVEGRNGQGGPQDGPIGTGFDRRRGRPGGEGGDEPAAELGVGGQRHEGGSSRDPAAQGRRTREERHG